MGRRPQTNPLSPGQAECLETSRKPTRLQNLWRKVSSGLSKKTGGRSVPRVINSDTLVPTLSDTFSLPHPLTKQCPLHCCVSSVPNTTKHYPDYFHPPSCELSYASSDDEGSSTDEGFVSAAGASTSNLSLPRYNIEIFRRETIPAAAFTTAIVGAAICEATEASVGGAPVVHSSRVMPAIDEVEEEQEASATERPPYPNIERIHSVSDPLEMGQHRQENHSNHLHDNQDNHHYGAVDCTTKKCQVHLVKGFANHHLAIRTERIHRSLRYCQSPASSSPGNITPSPPAGYSFIESSSSPSNYSWGFLSSSSSSDLSSDARQSVPSSNNSSSPYGLDTDISPRRSAELSLSHPRLSFTSLSMTDVRSLATTDGILSTNYSIFNNSLLELHRTGHGNLTGTPVVASTTAPPALKTLRESVYQTVPPAAGSYDSWLPLIIRFGSGEYQDWNAPTAPDISDAASSSQALMSGPDFSWSISEDSSSFIGDSSSPCCTGLLPSPMHNDRRRSYNSKTPVARDMANVFHFLCQQEQQQERTNNTGGSPEPRPSSHNTTAIAIATTVSPSTPFSDFLRLKYDNDPQFDPLDGSEAFSLSDIRSMRQEVSRFFPAARTAPDDRVVHLWQTQEQLSSDYRRPTTVHLMSFTDLYHLAPLKSSTWSATRRRLHREAKGRRRLNRCTATFDNILAASSRATDPTGLAEMPACQKRENAMEKTHQSTLLHRLLHRGNADKILHDQNTNNCHTHSPSAAVGEGMQGELHYSPNKFHFFDQTGYDWTHSGILIPGVINELMSDEDWRQIGGSNLTWSKDGPSLSCCGSKGHIMDACIAITATIGIDGTPLRIALVNDDGAEKEVVITTIEDYTPGVSTATITSKENDVEEEPGSDTQLIFSPSPRFPEGYSLVDREKLIIGDQEVGTMDLNAVGPSSFCDDDDFESLDSFGLPRNIPYDDESKIPSWLSTQWSDPPPPARVSPPPSPVIVATETASALSSHQTSREHLPPFMSSTSIPTPSSMPPSSSFPGLHAPIVSKNFFTHHSNSSMHLWDRAPLKRGSLSHFNEEAMITPGPGLGQAPIDTPRLLMSTPLTQSGQTNWIMNYEPMLFNSKSPPSNHCLFSELLTPTTITTPSLNAATAAPVRPTDSHSSDPLLPLHSLTEQPYNRSAQATLERQQQQYLQQHLQQLHQQQRLHDSPSKESATHINSRAETHMHVLQKNTIRQYDPPQPPLTSQQQQQSYHSSQDPSFWQQQQLEQQCDQFLRNTFKKYWDHHWQAFRQECLKALLCQVEKQQQQQQQKYSREPQCIPQSPLLPLDSFPPSTCGSYAASSTAVTPFATVATAMPVVVDAHTCTQQQKSTMATLSPVLQAAVQMADQATGTEVPDPNNNNTIASSRSSPSSSSSEQQSTPFRPFFLHFVPSDQLISHYRSIHVKSEESLRQLTLLDAVRMIGCVP